MIRKTFFPMSEDRLFFHSLVSAREIEHSMIDPTQRRLQDGIRQMVEHLDAQGYTTHPDIVAANVHKVVNRNTDGSIALTLMFPPEEPPVGQPARTEGGMGHGHQFAVPADAHPHRAGLRVEHKTRTGNSVAKRFYYAIGFDTATGEWIFRDRP